MKSVFRTCERDREKNAVRRIYVSDGNREIGTDGGLEMGISRGCGLWIKEGEGMG